MRMKSSQNESNMPACTECRRRKLGCSKERPTCKECRRLGTTCIYEAREKPGVKTGAVENLNRRVDKLEKLLEEAQEQSKRKYSDSESCMNWGNEERSPRAASDLLYLFEREMKEFRLMHPDQSSSTSGENEYPKRQSNFDSDSRRKRQRLNSGATFSWGDLILGSRPLGNAHGLSTTELLDAIVHQYFLQVHAWLPMLHEITFRQELAEQLYKPSLEVILHSMVVAALKFVNYPKSTPRLTDIVELTRQSREYVMLNGMNSLFVENLQALLIIAFDDIGNGDALNAWSIVGSLTRTVEYLQLSVEIDDDDDQPLLKPCPSVAPAKDLTDMETRRRVFWNVFALDRFCSVVTGWNTSLTSDDVRRRLPVDGVLWRKQEPVVAPFFGIWDKSAGRIGNSITFMPNHGEHHSPAATGDITQDEIENGTSTIGAFAYCIEATESMSRITTYFLQQKVNLHDQKQVGKWLTRFKELDLRLVHWKMFLPQKWKDTNISRQPTKVIMDPNLTLAHITHNASMILLHQLIAFPPSDWDWATRLPSHCSADTCQTAALETSSITENYLRSPTGSKIVNSQFIFCVFIAARVLLVYWRFYGETELQTEFFTLVDSLDIISERWNGSLEDRSKNQSNLAAKYAKKLRNMNEQCLKDPGYRIDVLAYANELGNTEIDISYNKSSVNGITAKKNNGGNVIRTNEVQWAQGNKQATKNETQETQEAATAIQIASNFGMNTRNQTVQRVQSYLPNQVHLPISPVSVQMPGNEESYNGIYSPQGPGMHEPGIVMDDLTSISQMFLDQQFLNRDRIISYDEGTFAVNLDWWDQSQSG